MAAVSTEHESSILVETGWLAERLDEPGIRIFDCSVMWRDSDDGNVREYFSGRDEWEKAHIPGSVFIDIFSVTDRGASVTMMPPPADFAARMEALGIGDGCRVVLYDNTNHAWAAFVWWMLRVIGFDNAAVLNGGWHKWNAEGRPTFTKMTYYPSGKLTVTFRPEFLVDRQRVLASISDDRVTMINALSADEHRGLVNRFPRAGRIPGSANVDCNSLIHPDTRAFLPPGELRKIFGRVGALNGKSVMSYCGGGVAASANALALTLLGVRDVALYNGGLIEWTVDPELPMETG